MRDDDQADHHPPRSGGARDYGEDQPEPIDDGGSAEQAVEPCDRGEEGARRVQVKEDPVQSDQRMGDDSNQKENLDPHDQRALEVLNDIRTRLQTRSQAAEIVIDDEMQDQYQHEQGTGGYL